ncbi:hypothetical protein D3C81_873220 [compost metagenome]
MSPTRGFLAEKVENYDLVLLHVVSSPRPQVLRATVERIYSARNGIDQGYIGKEIEFVRSPGNWGDAALEVGERALVFISIVSDEFYEDAWRGHMIVEEIQGDLFAIYQHRELWLCEEVPEMIRACSQQDPKRPYATAIRLGMLEAYLIDLVESCLH